MNRKKYIESLGATCKNWYWSWSFINEQTKTIIFGAWDIHDNGNISLILSEKWETNRKGQKSRGYPQSREHIRLIEEKGYNLLTFSMKYSDEYEDIDGTGPAKIGDFTPQVTPKELIRIGENWYASDEKDPNRISEELSSQTKYIEGTGKQVTVNAYERNGDARQACLEHHGYKCKVCEFDFEVFYGDIGKNYTHVHHIVPINEIKKEYEINPINDLVPVCPNCHAMIHRTNPALSVEELRVQIGKSCT